MSDKDSDSTGMSPIVNNFNGNEQKSNSEIDIHFRKRGRRPKDAIGNSNV